jgi:hypothetical protein
MRYLDGSGLTKILVRKVILLGIPRGERRSVVLPLIMPLPDKHLYAGQGIKHGVPGIPRKALFGCKSRDLPVRWFTAHSRQRIGAHILERRYEKEALHDLRWGNALGQKSGQI